MFQAEQSITGHISSMVENTMYAHIAFMLLTVIVSLALEFGGIEPVHRGFFRDDESISYPQIEESISTIDLILLTLFLPLACIAINCFAFKFSLPQAMMAVITFGSAFGINLLVTNGIKLVFGRLRPYFLSVCLPDYTKVNHSDIFVLADICTGDVHEIHEARLSFISGHSSLGAVSMWFLIWAVQKTWHQPMLQFAKPLVQSGFLLMSFWIASTRVTEYKHHAGDVIGGCLMGFFVATAHVFVSKCFDIDQSGKEVSAAAEHLPAAP